MIFVKAPLKVKWYCLELWEDGKHIADTEFPDMGDYEKFGSPYVDHVPNPWHVMRWAKSQGYQVDCISLDLMIGRWELECSDRYDDLFSEEVLG